jgi:hypothetical protein
LAGADVRRDTCEVEKAKFRVNYLFDVSKKQSPGTTIEWSSLGFARRVFEEESIVVIDPLVVYG